MTVSETLAAFAADLRLEDIPQDVLDLGRRHLLDTVGVMLLGAREDVIEKMTRELTRQFAAGPASVVGHAGRGPAHHVAMVNGTAAHADDFDDVMITAFAHPSAVVLPALLAIGEREGSSGADLLRAYIVGLEINARTGQVAGPAFVQRGTPAFPTHGVLAAAAAGATLLGLDAAGIASAMGAAGSMASGSFAWIAGGGDAKRTTSGWAASNAVLAADFARQGFEGTPAVIEGERAMLRAFTGTVDHDIAAITAGLGQDWLLRRMSLKGYPTCQGAQPYLYACSAIAAQNPPPPNTIEAVHLKVGAGVGKTLVEPFEVKARPSDAYKAKFSIPYLTALALRHGQLGAAELGSESLTDPDVLRIVDLLTYEFDDAFDEGTAVRAEVSVRYANGDERSARIDNPPGSPGHPLGWAEVEAKFRANVATRLPTERAETLIGRIRRVEELSTIGELAENFAVSA